MLKRHSSPVIGEGLEFVVLTHTEVSKDNRILKVIDVMLSFSGTRVVAVGRSLPNSKIPVSRQSPENLVVANLPASSRLWRTAVRLGRKDAGTRGRRFRRIFASVLLILDLIRMNFSAVAVVLKRARWNRTAVIYCNDEICLLAAVLLAKVTRAKIIYDAHELEHDKNGQSAFERRATFWWEKLFWPSIAYFITVSEAIRLHYLKQLGPKPSDVVLNSPAISSWPQKSSTDGVRNVLGLGSEDLILIYVGFFSEGRGIRTILGCAEQLPKDCHLVFLGEGDLKPEIDSHSEKFENVHVIGPIQPGSVVNFISSADIGLCLIEPVSLSDTFALPNKFFEYAFAGLPILYSDLPEMSRVAQTYNLGENCEMSVRSIFEGMSRLETAEKPLVSLAPLSQSHQQQVLRRILESFLAAHR